jgi:hypothetical protein
MSRSGGRGGGRGGSWHSPGAVGVAGCEEGVGDTDAEAETAAALEKCVSRESSPSPA